jgi:hypothetical protein
MRNLLLLLALALPAAAEQFTIGVVYVCKGEHVVVTGCDIHDDSDKGYCQAQWNDRTGNGGFPAYTSETRGSMRKLLPTCTPPTQNQLDAHARFEKNVSDYQKKAVADQEEAFRRANQPKGPSTDHGGIAARKCIAAGRSEMECISEGFSKSFKSLAGGTGLDTLFQQPAGLRLNGTYKSPSGFSINFDPGTATHPATATFGCGKIQPITGGYEFSFKDGVISARIPNQPAPIPVTLSSATRLTGPAQAVVEGQIIVGWTNGGGGGTQAYAGGGSHTETHMESRSIDYGEAHNGSYNATDIQQNGMEYSVNTPVTTTTYDEPAATPRRPSGPSPIFAPRTEHCTIGSLASTGPTSGPTGVADVLSVLGGSDTKKPLVPPGVRLVGNYKGAGDLSVEFRSDVAIIDCGEVQVAGTYTMEPAGRDFAIHINAAQPIALTYHPDGSLSGPASIHINGRVMTGMTGNQYNYAPSSATCSMSTLRP